MAKKNKNSNPNWEDYEDMRGKGVRKERRKARRHEHKHRLKEVDPDDSKSENWDYYMDAMENFEGH